MDNMNTFGDGKKGEQIYPDYIMRKLRQYLGLDDENDTSRDEEINKELTPNEVFEFVCKWDGLQGAWHEKLKDWIKDIYGVDISVIGVKGQMEFVDRTAPSRTDSKKESTDFKRPTFSQRTVIIPEGYGKLDADLAQSMMETMEKAPSGHYESFEGSMISETVETDIYPVTWDELAKATSEDLFGKIQYTYADGSSDMFGVISSSAEWDHSKITVVRDNWEQDLVINRTSATNARRLGENYKVDIAVNSVIHNVEFIKEKK